MFTIYRDSRQLMPDVLEGEFDGVKVKFQYGVESEYLRAFQDWIEAGNNPTIILLNADNATIEERLEAAELMIDLLLTDTQEAV